MNRPAFRCSLLVALIAGAVAIAGAAAPPVVPVVPVVPVDHHQHLLSPAMIAPGQQPITAAKLVVALDAAGIRRAVILSNAYRFGSPQFAVPNPDEYQRVVAENDWTAREAAKYPRRLVAFCSINPLKNYALGELARCARDPRFGRGLKLQFGSSDVDLDDPTDIAMLRRIFRVANAERLALVIHLRPSESRQRLYGAAEAQVFLDQLLTQAPDVAVQIAHLGGGGGGAFEPAAEEALAVFAAAFIQKDPRVRNLWFDVSGITGGADAAARAPKLVELLRAIGTKHLLYGSDGGDPTDPPPKDALASFRKLPLTAAELRAIEGNVAPYLKP
jgi:predicted TIM-barrel fold metal-dependent hydrolase